MYYTKHVILASCGNAEFSIFQELFPLIEIIENTVKTMTRPTAEQLNMCLH